MGIAGLQDTFQEKMSSLMFGLEFIRVYIDDLLCILTSMIDDHLDKLRQVLTQLSDANLKVNAPKSYFCQTECEYLWYVLTREGTQTTKD